jgi:FkbM family methyltransferase
MEQLSVALGLFSKAPARQWPNLAFYFFGRALFRATGLKLFRERELKLKEFVAVADVEGNCGLNFLHEIVVRDIYGFKKFLGDPSVKVVFDVGANSGFFTLWALSQNPALRVICFEPHPISAARLRKHIRANSAGGSITLIEAAAGSSSGRCTLNVSPTSSMGFVSTSTHKLFENGGHVEVEITTLDTFAASNQQWPDLLKIDVEGFEVEVLKGASRCLSAAKYVILEFHSEQLRKDCVKLLDGAGFRIECNGWILFAERNSSDQARAEKISLAERS